MLINTPGNLLHVDSRGFFTRQHFLRFPPNSLKLFSEILFALRRFPFETTGNEIKLENFRGGRMREIGEIRSSFAHSRRQRVRQSSRTVKCGTPFGRSGSIPMRCARLFFSIFSRRNSLFLACYLYTCVSAGSSSSRE